ncbi:hypothetical protein [Streptomyces sp. NPDC047108]|uniref:hypothetical protein n=1 Tax=Streptomyces sp. NPDC047108 TaxID=3155025 RepID=UPI0033EEEBA7
MEAAETRAVLAHTEELRQRARADRRASSVPLITFGVIIMLSAPFTYVPFGPLWRSEGLYWWVAVPVGFLAIAFWYRTRRIRTGIGSGRGAYVVAALASALLLGFGLTWVFGGGPLGITGLALLILAVVQRNAYLTACAAALAVIGSMENDAMITDKANDIAVRIVGEPSHGGWLYGVPPLVQVLLGLTVLAAGLVALRNERAAR